MQINCFYHLYLMYITGIYYYLAQKIGLKDNIFKLHL